MKYGYYSRKNVEQIDAIWRIWSTFGLQLFQFVVKIFISETCHFAKFYVSISRIKTKVFMGCQCNLTSSEIGYVIFRQSIKDPEAGGK